ncbi:Alpha/Beta hydrolase protein [Mycena capillaripes]|nr:Alpha/Beta hydrolase protein [Mycena capillaripes]
MLGSRERLESTLGPRNHMTRRSTKVAPTLLPLLSTMSQYSYLSEPDPELPSVPPIVGPITPDFVPTLREGYALELPKRMDRLRPHLPADSDYTVEDHTIAVQDGEICVRTISPTPTKDEHPGFPVLVFFHGGGWVVGHIDANDFEVRKLSVDLRVTIATVGYRLAPEHPFPTGLNDCYAGLKWTVTECEMIRGSLDKGFIVGGVSAGANFAAAVVHRAYNDSFFEHHKITGQMLQIPALIHPAAYPPEYAGELLSYEQNKDAPILSKAKMDMFYECYGGPPADLEVSPLLASADLTNLPPAYIQVCGLDPLRNEGLLYERLLRERLKKAHARRYPGRPHGFHSTFPVISAVKKWETDLRAGIGWLKSLV